MNILIVCWLMFGWWLWFMNVKWNIKNFVPAEDWWWDIIALIVELFIFLTVGPILLMVFYYATQLDNKRNFTS